MKRSKEAIDKQRLAISGHRNCNFGKPRLHGKNLWLRLPTGEVVHMRSRWEAFFADYLTGAGIAWAYEPQTFILSDGSAYTPDFIAGGIYFEIKGYMTAENQRKIDLFRGANGSPSLLVIGLREMNQLGFPTKRPLVLAALTVVSGRETTCANCGKKFLARQKTSCFCSRTCVGRRNRKNQKATMTCAVCGRTLKVYPSVAKRSKACSKKCSFVLSGASRSGSNHWRNRHEQSRGENGQFVRRVAV